MAELLVGLSIVQPYKEKSVFWHTLWVNCGRPRSGAVADCMSRTRAAYHYAIRGIKKDGERVQRERMAHCITVCAVAQHCYNGDVSFLWEKWKL